MHVTLQSIPRLLTTVAHSVWAWMLQGALYLSSTLRALSRDTSNLETCVQHCIVELQEAGGLLRL